MTRQAPALAVLQLAAISEALNGVLAAAVVVLSRFIS